MNKHTDELIRISKCPFYEFGRQDKNWFVNFLYNERLRHILRFICKKHWESCIVLDLGCGRGHFSNVLSLKFMTVGLDLRRFKWRSQTKHRNRNFVIADMQALPFRSESIDLVVCASVLEHSKNLKNLVMKIKNVLKKGGFLVAGYPVETRFFKFVWKRLSPRGFSYIDQSQVFWRNPSTGKVEYYLESPSTHKQNYQTIRKAIKANFIVIHSKKLPLPLLPDALSYYEWIYAVAR